MKRYGLGLAIFLVLIINGVVLASIQRNRSAEPDATVELTERELGLNRSSKENSGISLRLNWRHFQEEDLAWFDRKKLQDLGFDCTKSVDDSDAELYYTKALPRKAFVVLEYAGPAWEEWMARQKRKLDEATAEATSGTAKKEAIEQAQKRFAFEQTAGSRLFVVDAGNDPAALRRNYPNRSRYIITSGVVRLHFCQRSNDLKSSSKSRRLSGSVQSILTETIHVPRDLAGKLSSLQGTSNSEYSSLLDFQQTGPKQPRFSVVLKYGKHFEPWVATVRGLEQK